MSVWEGTPVGEILVISRIKGKYYLNSVMGFSVPLGKDRSHSRERVKNPGNTIF